MNSVDFGKNIFCGPSVISAITGINTDEAEKIIQSITGQIRDVKSVYVVDLMASFRKLGYETEVVPIKAGSIFGNMFHIHENGCYVFTVPGHFVAIEIDGSHRYICDNHSKYPLNVASSARIGQKVVHIFKVTKLNENPTTKTR